jgi:hypothetical protein
VIDFGDFDYWYFEELVDDPPDGVGTGNMDHWYFSEMPDIYADGNPPATPVFSAWIM